MYPTCKFDEAEADYGKLIGQRPAVMQAASPETYSGKRYRFK